MRVKFPAAACLLAAALLGGCDQFKGRTVYKVQGTVQRTYPGECRIQVAHDDIPGYMQAMTMDFDARDPALLIGLDTGDRIRFDLVLTRERGWIENVRRIGRAPAREPLLAKSKSAGELWARPLKPGETIPNIAFTNELGHAVRLADHRGEALVLTFIFTRCPFPNYCPRMTKHLAQVHESLAFIANAPTNWHLFSVSFDPEFDQPSVLMDYRRNVHAVGERWNFLTGAPEDIKRFCAAFGVYFTRDRGTINHNLMTAVVDTQGRLQRLFPGNNWQTDEVINELASAAALAQPENLVAK